MAVARGYVPTRVCTIVALFGVHREHPLLVAANRDEFYARPTAGPTALLEAPRTVGGRDLSKGGTWMAVTQGGLVVAVTNQRSYGVHDAALRSRGELVLETARKGSFEAATAYLRAVDARDYNAFNLLFGDARSLAVAYARRETREVAIERLDAGTWILANDRIGSPEFPKTARAAALAARLERPSFPELADAAHTMLADHELPPLEKVPPPPHGSHWPHELLQKLQALCIHTPAYGTRSSTLVAVGDGRVDRYLFADGPPCTTPFVDRTSLLTA